MATPHYKFTELANASAPDVVGDVNKALLEIDTAIYENAGGAGINSVAPTTVTVPPYVTSETSVSIGNASSAQGAYAVAIGREARAAGNGTTCIGDGSACTGEHSVAIGFAARVDGARSVALPYTTASEDDVLAVGDAARARRIIGAADPVDAQDAATRNYVINVITDLCTKNNLTLPDWG